MLKQGQADPWVTEGISVGDGNEGGGVWAHYFSFLLKELPPNKIVFKEPSTKAGVFLSIPLLYVATIFCIMSFRTPSLCKYRAVINSFHWAADYS